MERNMRSTYMSSGPRSLPHAGSKRHSSGGSRLSPPASHHRSDRSDRSERSERFERSDHIMHNNNNNQTNGQHDDIINYIYDSWNKVTREVDRGNDEAKYYQEVMTPRQLANFRPFNLEEWWARRLLQSIKCNKHRS